MSFESLKKGTFSLFRLGTEPQTKETQPQTKNSSKEDSSSSESSEKLQLPPKSKSSESSSSSESSEKLQLPPKSKSSSSSENKTPQLPQSRSKSQSSSESLSSSSSSTPSAGEPKTTNPGKKEPPPLPKKQTPRVPSPPSTSSSPEPQPARRQKIPRRPSALKKSEYELKTGGGTFYVIQKPSNDDKRNQFKRTQTFYEEPGMDEQGKPKPARYNEDEPAFFSPAFNETTYKQNGEEPTYSELAEWNRESYTKFIQEPAVRFARSVAGKLRLKKWQELFENPDEALIEYRKNTIPRDTDNIFGKVDVQAVFDTLKVALLDPTVSDAKVNDLKQKLVQDLETLKRLWNLGSSAQQRAKEVVAREVFLTSIYHAPYVIFGCELQTAIDTVISHIKDKCPQVKDFDKNIIFGHLIDSDTWLSPFVEAVANRIVDSDKSRGYSRSVVQARYDNLHYVQLIARFMNYYKFDDAYIHRGTDKTLETLNKTLGL